MVNCCCWRANHYLSYSFCSLCSLIQRNGGLTISQSSSVSKLVCSSPNRPKSLHHQLSSYKCLPLLFLWNATHNKHLTGPCEQEVLDLMHKSKPFKHRVSVLPLIASEWLWKLKSWWQLRHHFNCVVPVCSVANGLKLHWHRYGSLSGASANSPTF